MKKSKQNEIDFSLSRENVASGIIENTHGMNILVFLCANGDLCSTSRISDHEALKAAVLFFADVFNNIKQIGNFVNYGISEFPVSYAKESQNNVLEFKQFDNQKVFEERLSLLKKEYYDLMLDYINKTK